MGTILNELPGSKIHAEARRESFSLYTDFGKQGFEVEWDQFPLMKDLVERLQPFYEKFVAAKAAAERPDPCACGMLSDMAYAGNVSHEGRYHQRNGCWPHRAGMFSQQSFLFTWVSPDDCAPPHGITHDRTYELLIAAFLKKEEVPGSGWDTNEPALIGYPLNGRIQLLSGSHRWAAAKEAGIKIPVLIRQRSVIEQSFGILEEWEKVMKAPASKEASE